MRDSRLDRIIPRFSWLVIILLAFGQPAWGMSSVVAGRDTRATDLTGRVAPMSPARLPIEHIKALPAWFYSPPAAHSRYQALPSLSKDASVQVATYGQVFTYTLVFTIPAGISITGVSLHDQLPDNDPSAEPRFLVEAGSAVGPFPINGPPLSPAPIPIYAGDEISWDLPDISNTGMAPYVYAVTYRAAVDTSTSRVRRGEVGTNQVVLSWNGGSTSASVNVTMVAPNVQVKRSIFTADGERAESPGADRVLADLRAGELVTVTVLVTNVADSLASPAYNVRFRDYLPTWINYEAVIEGAEPVRQTVSSPAGTRLEWMATTRPGGTVDALNVLAVGDTFEVTYRARVSSEVAPGRVDSRQTEANYYYLPPVAGSSATVNSGSIEFRSPPVTLVKTAHDELPPGIEVVAGEIVTYTVVYTLPAGTTLYTPAYLQDRLEDGLRFLGVVSQPAGLGAPTVDESQDGFTTVQWDMAAPLVVSSDLRHTFVLTAQVSPTRFLGLDAGQPLIQGEELVNQAVLYWRDESGGTRQSNTGAASVWLVRPDIQPEKLKEAPLDQFPGANSPVRFELGNIQSLDTTYGDTAYNVVITDALPANWTFVEAEPDGVVTTVDGRTMISWGPVPVLTTGLYLPGHSPTADSYVVTATSPLTVAVGEPHTNSLQVSYESAQGYRYTGQDDLVMALPLAISKQIAPASPFMVGQIVTYSLVGIVPAYAALYWPHHVDTLPAGVRYTGWYEVEGGTLAQEPVTSTAGGLETLEWWWEPIDNTGSSEPRTFIFRFAAALAGTNTDGVLVWTNYIANTSINNLSSIEWNTENVSGTYPVRLSANRSSLDRVIQPYLVAPSVPPAKTLLAGGPLVEAGDLLTFTFRVYNTGRAPAYDVMILDALPAGLAFHSYQARVYPASTVARPAYVPTALTAPIADQHGTLTWVFDEVAQGDGNYSAPTTQMLLTYTVRVSESVGSGAVLTNYASVADYTSLPGEQARERHYAYLGSAGDQAGPVSVPEAQISKQVAANEVALGEQVVFTLTVPDPALGATLYHVAITDTLPAGTPGPLLVSAVEAFGVTSLQATSHEVVATYDSILAGSQMTLVITARVPITAVGGLVHNEALVTWEDAPTGGNAHAATSNSVGVTIVAPEVTVSKAGPSAVYPGATLPYTITYENNGLIAASEARLTDTLPAGVTYVDSHSDRPVAQVGAGTGLLVWDLGDLLPGENGTIWVTTTVWTTAALGSLLVNDVRIHTISAGDDPANNQDAVTTVVGGAALAAAKTATPDPVWAGGQVHYTLVVTNSGFEQTQGLVITDRLPAGTALVEAGAGGSLASGVLTWDQFEIEPGGNAVVTFTVQVDSAAISGTQVVNRAYGAAVDNGGMLAPAPPVVVTVQDTRLALAKTATPDPVPADDLVHYTLVVTNVGAVLATSVVITDRVPTGTVFESASPGGQLSVENVVQWRPVKIEVGGRREVTFSVRVPVAVVSGTLIVNQAYRAWADNAAPVSGGPVTVTVLSRPILFIEKSGPAMAAPGEHLVYTIHYGNRGNAFAHNVRITESWDANTAFVEASPMPTQGNNVWQVDELSPGTDYTIVVTVQLGAFVSYGTRVTNMVAVGSDETGSQIDVVSTLVGGGLVYMPLTLKGYSSPLLPPGVNLLVEDIQVDPDPPAAGEAMRVTVTLHNLGADAVTEDFWVDLYMDPVTTPTVNVLWDDIAPYGKAWIIRETIPGGGRLVIHTDQPDDPENPNDRYSNWPGWFISPGEHTLYVQVDSYGWETGLVEESDEMDNVSGRAVTVLPGNAVNTIPPVQWQERR